MRSAVDRIAAQHAGAQQSVAALATLLNVSGASIEWSYLNSGVHDAQRDHELDRATVRVIVESIKHWTLRSIPYKDAEAVRNDPTLTLRAVRCDLLEA